VSADVLHCARAIVTSEILAQTAELRTLRSAAQYQRSTIASLESIRQSLEALRGFERAETERWKAKALALEADALRLQAEMQHRHTTTEDA
jgi:hypothetical protein